uniref:Uncharacterized protein n=1 Tax=Anopheles epiroticus TaxID=199890 RepID=A0A182P4H1_9DIPT
MPAMADRCLSTSAERPSTITVSEASRSTVSSSAAFSPPPSSFGTDRGLSRSVGGPAAAAAGPMVCGLIGKFECTRTVPADVKVTANSCRASDSALIADGDGPIAGGASPPDGREAPTVTRFREIVASNRNECADKPAMGIGGTGNGTRMDAACVHRSGERQRKTVVYSRLCLDDALLLEDAGLLGSGARKPTGPVQNGPARDERESGGRSSRQAEVIRFPCVERLIELYANIIRQQEAEVQRFMSSIVRSGDKSRLDKGARWGRAPAGGPHGSEEQQGDIRKELALPASVSLESLPRTKTLVGDGTNSSSSTVRSLDDAVRASRTTDSSSPAQSDEGWRSSTQPASPYGSSDEEDRGHTTSGTGVTQEAMKNRDRVTRSSSSDSALGLDDELSQQEQQQAIATVGKVRRLTLGVSDIPLRAALLPVPEPSTLPSLTATLIGDQHQQHPTVVRSKMILEAQLIELPLATEPTTEQQAGSQQLGCPPSTSVSRRESAQSYVSETGDGVRYVRTPSVVVSDYSDDTMCGITLEEIEYFRRHRLRRGSADCESDISAASSCSNLNYCGSSISALDGCDYQCGLRTPERKVSDCSTCSTVSCDEDEGYSVVRSKLANLHLLPADTVAEEPTEHSSPASPESSAISNGVALAVAAVAAATDPASAEQGDVRVCSKKKVSHVAHRHLAVDGAVKRH